MRMRVLRRCRFIRSGQQEVSMPKKKTGGGYPPPVAMLHRENGYLNEYVTDP